MKFTKKEKILYTLIICLLMEFLMAYYNYFFHTDAFLHEAFLLACAEFVPAFVIGFTCEWLFVSRIAKKIAVFLHREHFQDKNIVHVNEFLLSIGMVLVISVYGALLHNTTKGCLLVLIMKDFIKNAVVGIPLFVFGIGPFARWLIKHEHKE